MKGSSSKVRKRLEGPADPKKEYPTYSMPFDAPIGIDGVKRIRKHLWLSGDKTLCDRYHLFDRITVRGVSEVSCSGCRHALWLLERSDKTKKALLGRRAALDGQAKEFVERRLKEETARKEINWERGLLYQKEKRKRATAARLSGEGTRETGLGKGVSPSAWNRTFGHPRKSGTRIKAVAREASPTPAQRFELKKLLTAPQDVGGSTVQIHQNLVRKGWAKFLDVAGNETDNASKALTVQITPEGRHAESLRTAFRDY